MEKKKKIKKIERFSKYSVPTTFLLLASSLPPEEGDHIEIVSGESLLGHSNFWVSPRDCLWKCCLASTKVISRSPLAAYRHGGQSVSTEKCPAHIPCDKALIETSQQTHFCQTAPGPFPGESGALSLEFRLRLDWEWCCETWLEEKKKKKKVFIAYLTIFYTAGKFENCTFYLLC